MCVEYHRVVVSAETSEVMNDLWDYLVFLSVFPVRYYFQKLKVKVVSGWSEVFLFNLRPFSTAVDQNCQKVNAKYLQLLKLCDGPLKSQKRHYVIGQKKTDPILKRHFINQGAIVTKLA